MKVPVEIKPFPFHGIQITLRQLTARQFQELTEKSPDLSGVKFAAALLELALVDPKPASVEDALLDMPVSSINELVELVLRHSGIDPKNAG